MAKLKKPTMLDVAREAGVSYQTVSRVINGHPSVAPSTRERVQHIIAQLNYRPSKVARSLATRQSRSIALITYGMQHYGPTQMMVNIERSTKLANYDLIFANIDPSSDEDVTTTIANIERWSIDGLLLIAPVRSTRYAKLVDEFAHLPLVQIDIAAGAAVPSVILDQYQGSYDITQHLLQLGHTRLSTIHGPQNWYGAAARHRGFLDALAAAHLTPVASVAGDWTPQSGYDCTKQLLQMYTFTALLVANDQMALGALRALHESHHRIPQDISIVGFDDIPEANFLLPRLTTVHQDFSELGRRGIEQLLKLIVEPDYSGEQVVIPTRLIVRDSTAAH